MGIFLIVILGYLIGKSIAAENYFSFLGIFGFLALLFIPEFAALILCFLAIQLTPTEHFMILKLGSLGFYIWDPIILLLFFRLGSGIALGRKKWPSTPINPLIYALFAWGLVSVAYNYRLGEDHFYFTLVSLLRTLSMTSLFFLVGGFVDGKEKIKSFSKIVMFCVIFQVGLAIIQRIGAFTGFYLPTQIFNPRKGAIYGSIDYRSVGTIGNPNILGQAILLFSFPVLMSFLEKGGHTKRWILSSLILVGIILTGSRSAYLGTVVLLLFLIHQLRRRRIKSLIQLLILGGLVFYFLKDYFFHRVLSEFEVFDISRREFLFDPGSSTTTRWDIWYNKLSFGAHSPIFGYGWSGGFWASASLLSGGTDSHNQYVETLVDLGIPGLIIFIGLHSYILYLTWKLRSISEDPFYAQLSKALFVSFLGFYAAMWGVVTLETGNPVTGIFWALAGLVMSARRIALQERQTFRETDVVGSKVYRGY
ncbi:MAG: O-antigen ligase family protein [Candidatus Brocadiaceae bacterium]|nr:O-antigen ligase family protein [Candidatus Brocadiaceae bacterium]